MLGFVNRHAPFRCPTSPRRLAARLALAIGAAWYGTAVQAATDGDVCDQLADRRSEAGQRSDLSALQQAATAYVDRCRGARSRIEVAGAMAELSWVRRSAGQADEALATAQTCIRFEYLALTCHIEKAMALQALGMKSEAKQVLGTSREVVAKLRTQGKHDLARLSGARGQVKPEDVNAIAREAQARLNMATIGERVLDDAERTMGRP